MNRFAFGDMRRSYFVIYVLKILDSELRMLETSSAGHKTYTLCISFSRGELTENDIKSSYAI